MTEALATKYRPKNFDDVTEQKSIKVILQQQLESGEIRHAYLFTGGAGTGKTTTARIFANEINRGKGNPLELDAASNNSVDDIRNIIQQAKVQSMDSEYRIFILDECVTGDVEVLTDVGFKRFDECNGDEKVAQYTDEGTIEFVKPTSWIKNPYNGQLIKWCPRNWCSVRMTPHHVQPLYYTRSGCLKENYIEDVKFGQHNNLIVSGAGVGTKVALTPIDRLVIASQADGSIQSINKEYVHWSIQLSKQRKIDRLLEICAAGGIQLHEISARPGYRRFTYGLPLTSSKSLSTYFNLVEFNSACARQFIDEVVQWDGYIGKGYVQYTSTVKENCDFVSAVGCLGGYSARQRVQVDNRKGNYKDCYKVLLYDKKMSNCEPIKKTVEYEFYSGCVYCVKVPSHKIVVRSGGFVFVTGNCHSLSNSAWQAMLKMLEEPPKKSIFIMCTTNPEKIPKTILSRVQRFDFKRISTEGIYLRLFNIIACENGWNSKTMDAKEPLYRDPLYYIAKLADGGMRDAITLLDKCLAYSRELTVDNIISALGTVDYELMFELCDAFHNKDDEYIIKIIEIIHNDGKDLKQFIKDFLTFLLDVNKYDITGKLDYTQLPETYETPLKNYEEEWFRDCQELLRVVVHLNADIKWDTQPKTTIEARLLLGE